MDTNEYNRNFYSKIFEKESERYYRIQEKKIRIVTSLFEKQRGGRILDVGCADGFISTFIAKKTEAKIYGLDISRKAVSMAIRKGITAKVVNIDTEAFPFEKESFDAVFCGDVLEHVYDTENLLRKINRVLKMNGHLIISIPNIASWYNRGFLLLGFMPTWIESSLKTYTGNPFIKEGVGHIHAFTKRSVCELLALNGFATEKAAGSPILGDGMRKKWKERIWNGVDSTFARKVTLASTIIIKARKCKDIKTED